MLSLVVIPVLDTLKGNGENENCCVMHDESTQSDSQENHDNGCCDGTCNPLINCCGMMGFLIPNPIQLTIHKGVVKHEIFDMYGGHTAQYFSEYWQPPKV